MLNQNWYFRALSNRDMSNFVIPFLDFSACFVLISSVFIKIHEYEGDSIFNDIVPINQKVLDLYALLLHFQKICYLAIQLQNRSYPAHFPHCTNRLQDRVLSYTAIRT